MNNVFKNIMVWKKQSDWYDKDTYKRNINLVKKNENISFEI